MGVWPSSLRARLTLWYSALLGLPLIGFAVACYLIFANALYRRTDRFIHDALTAVTNEMSAERKVSLTAREAMQRTLGEVRFRDLHVGVLDPGLHTVATTDPDPAVRDSVIAVLTDRDSTLALTVAAARGSYRAVARPLQVGAERFVLTGSYPLGDVEAMLARIRNIFLLAIPLLVAVAATGGWLLAWWSLAPVASMAAQAASISATSLDKRLPVAGSKELVSLARVINDLLDRLERAFTQQARFVADASHELRTPTAIIRTEADVTLSRDQRPEAEYRESVEVMRSASHRLARIVDELFLLARSDAGHLVSMPEAIYLEDLVNDGVRAVSHVAEKRGVRIALTNCTEAPSHGDPDLLGRLLLNLFDNAIKYSPKGGRVEVTMRPGNRQCHISVIDEGPGIPAMNREQIFERFFRGDTARQRAETTATSGAGLGLAIARRIAEMHGGTLELGESRPGRTEFRLTLPMDNLDR